MPQTYEQFIHDVQSGAAIGREEAERVTRATLETLADRIARGEARDLAAELDPQLSPWLATDTDARGFDADEFLRRVAERAKIDPARAARDVRGVFHAVRRAITAKELHDLLSELPRDYEPFVSGGPPPGADTIIGSIAERAGLDPDEARRATVAVLETLAERIAGGEVDDLARSLPVELHPPLRTGRSASGGKARAMSLEDFLAHVSAREGVSPEEARDHARAVFAALREALPEREFLDVAAQLPQEYAAVGAQP
jgi:uncharacterized protein (DUF2267 family)